MCVFLTRFNACIFVALVVNQTGVSCQHINDVKRLIRDKELSYDKSVRPVTNQSNPITVYLDFHITSIIDVNELQQAVTISGVFIMKWIDEEIAWDPNEYGSLDILKVESSRFWSPSIYCANTNDKLQKIGEPYLTLMYMSDGTVHSTPGTIVTVKCKLDIRFYPWDRHACQLLFSAWGYEEHEIKFKNTSNKVSTRAYGPNGSWNLIYSSVYLHSGVYAGYVVTVVIERQPTYIMVNVILPVIVLSILNLLVFFVPNNSGERLSYCITLLLAIAVFLTIVSDTLPKTSTPMAVVSYYLFSTLVMSNFITVSVIYSLCLYNRDKSKSIGSCWELIARVVQCKYRRRKRRTCSKNERLQEPNMEYKGSMPYSINRKSKVAYLDPDKSETVERYSERVIEECTDRTVTWETVSNVFDRLCFMFYLIVQIIITTVSYAYIYMNIEDPETLIEKIP
ncbi:hypothetical protein ACF0H5_007538 [Mactra antiquata]